MSELVAPLKGHRLGGWDSACLELLQGFHYVVIVNITTNVGIVGVQAELPAGLAQEHHVAIQANLHHPLLIPNPEGRLLDFEDLLQHLAALCAELEVRVTSIT